MLHNSIWNYYGLQNCDGRTLQNYQYEYANPIETSKELVELGDTAKEHSIVLFIAIRAATILDRKLQPHILVKRKFGLSCDLLFEYQVPAFEDVSRICAVKVHHGQFSVLLKTLFDWSSYSFAIIFNEHEPSNLITRLLSLFEDGLLTPRVIKACSNAALSESASFLHIIRGNDGYSVNLFSNQ